MVLILRLYKNASWTWKLFNHKLLTLFIKNEKNMTNSLQFIYCIKKSWSTKYDSPSDSSSPQPSKWRTCLLFYKFKHNVNKIKNVLMINKPQKHVVNYVNFTLFHYKNAGFIKQNQVILFSIFIMLLLLTKTLTKCSRTKIGPVQRLMKLIQTLP